MEDLNKQYVKVFYRLSDETADKLKIETFSNFKQCDPECKCILLWQINVKLHIKRI